MDRSTFSGPAPTGPGFGKRETLSGIPRIAALSTKQSSLFSAGDPATGRALTIQAAARDGYTAAALTFSRARTAG